MKLPKMTNFVIIALMAAAVIQTGTLWLGDSASHNFFYTVFNVLGSDAFPMFDGVTALDCENITVGYGNKRFSVLYPKSDKQDVMEQGDSVIKRTLSDGVYLESEEINWEEYLDGKVVIYNFPFSVSASEYTKGFQVKSSSITSRVKAFQYIVLMPGRSAQENHTICFLNTETNEAVKFSLENSPEAQNLYEEIGRLQQTGNQALIYISAKQIKFNNFQDDVFIPQWVNSTYEYSPLEKTNPYADSSGKVIQSILEDETGSFFTSLSPRYSDKDESGVYLLSDENNVVKYYPEGMLEYYNYAGSSDSEQTLSTAYGACKRFLRKDTALDTDIFLSGVALNSDGLTFYFDYTVNNLPVYLSNENKQNLGTDHAIEVIVKNNVVKKYKRYAFNFNLEEQKNSTANMDLVAAVDGIMSATGIMKFDDIALGYLADDSNELGLKWFVEAGGTAYIWNTLREEAVNAGEE